MSSKTRIIVLHMKEIIYTAVFLALAVVLAVVLFFMFGPGKNASHTASEKSRYKPGVYTSSITLNENTFDVEVTVNADRIKAIRLVNLNETTKLPILLWNRFWILWQVRSIPVSPWKTFGMQETGNIPPRYSFQLSRMQ